MVAATGLLPPRLIAATATMVSARTGIQQFSQRLAILTEFRRKPTLTLILIAGSRKSRGFALNPLVVPCWRLATGDDGKSFNTFYPGAPELRLDFR